MLLLASLLLGSLGVASPGPDPLDARVRVRAEGCPGASLAERVRAQLGDVTAAAAIEVDGTLRLRDDGQWELALVIARGDDEPSERSFVAPHCETALDAAALVVAIAMDPARDDVRVPDSPPASEPQTQPPERVAATGAATAPQTQKAAAQPPEPRTPAPRTRKLRGLVRAGGGIDGGGLPRASAMFEVAAGAFGRGWRAELTGIYRLQSQRAATQDPGAGGRFSLWAAGARGCGVPSRRAIEFPLCAAIEAGQLIVEGYGFSGAKTARRPWSAVVLGPGIAWVLRKNVALVVQAALGLPLVRSEIAIDNLEVLHTTGPVLGRGWIGFEGRFP